MDPFLSFIIIPWQMKSKHILLDMYITSLDFGHSKFFCYIYRYYYKTHIFEAVLGRRLVYKFGKNAKHWQPANPNFPDLQPREGTV